MKKVNILLLLAAMLFIPKQLKAQDEIRIAKFEENPLKLEARTNPVFDNNGEAYAIICFEVRDNNVDIDANLGYKKREDLVSIIKLWVPKGTKRLTIRRENLRPYIYNIPVEIESKKLMMLYWNGTSMFILPTRTTMFT